MSARLLILAGAVAAGGVLVGGLYLKGRADGRAIEQAAIVARINKENQNAGNAAERWRAALRDCAGRGKLFDFERGACEP